MFYFVIFPSTKLFHSMWLIALFKYWMSSLLLMLCFTHNTHININKIWLRIYAWVQHSSKKYDLRTPSIEKAHLENFIYGFIFCNFFFTAAQRSSKYKRSTLKFRYSLLPLLRFFFAWVLCIFRCSFFTIRAINKEKTLIIQRCFRFILFNTHNESSTQSTNMYVHNFASVSLSLWYCELCNFASSQKINKILCICHLLKTKQKFIPKIKRNKINTGLFFFSFRFLFK